MENKLQQIANHILETYHSDVFSGKSPIHLYEIIRHEAIEQYEMYLTEEQNLIVEDYIGKEISLFI